MRIKKNIVLLLFLSLSPCNKTLWAAQRAAQCTSQNEKIIQEATGKQLFQIVDNAKTRVFSDDFIIKNAAFLKPISKENAKTEFDSWNELMTCAHKFILDQSTTSPIYIGDIKQLEIVTTYLKNKIELLNNKYGNLFAAGPKQTIIIKKGSSITSLEKNELESMQHELNNYIAGLSAIASHALTTMNKNTVLAKSQGFEEFVDKDPKKILPNYQKILKSYQEANTEKKFNDLLKKSIKEHQKVNYFLEKLEALHYRLKANSDPENLILIIDNVLEKIRKQFPDAITILDSLKLAATNDKASVIIFAEAGALRDTLIRISNQISLILKNTKVKK